MVDRDAVRVSIFFLSNLPNSMDNELFKVPFLYSPQIIPAMGIITNFARFFFFNSNTFSYAQNTLLGLQKSQIYLVFMGW